MICGKKAPKTVLTDLQKRKHSRGTCIEFRCSKPHGVKKLRCNRHHEEFIKANDPERYAFRSLKKSARKRGKDFTLTFVQFMLFLKENPGYMKKKGKSVKSLTIDRKDNSKGYHYDNIQCITLRENIRKYHDVDKWISDGEDDCPF